MIRPKARAALRRWRDVLIGLALIALGLWWIAGTGLIVWAGGAVAALGGAVLLAGVQRLRFDRGEDGPGIVSVDERRIAYMGPLSGGAVALDELRRLDLDPTARPDPVWVMTGPDAVLHVPVTARGSDALLGAFAALPGLETGRMLGELSRGGDAAVTIWERPSERAARSAYRLH